MKKLCNVLVVCTLLALGALSCTNKEYDLNNINTEMTVFGDGFSIYAGHIDTLTVDSLLNMLDMDMDMLNKGNNGDLSILFDSSFQYAIEDIKIDPITGIMPTIDPIDVALSSGNVAFPEEGFALPEVEYNYTAQIPTYTINDASTVLPSLHFDINTDIGLSGVTIPDNGSITVPVIAGLSASPKISGETEVDLSFPCPEQVRGINKVYFEGDGADITINFDLKALGAVAAENTITSLDVILPEGYDVTIENDYNGQLQMTKDHHLKVTNLSLGSTGGFQLKAHLKSVDLSHCTPEVIDGKRQLVYKDKLTYDLQYTFKTKNGTVTISKATLPLFSIIIDGAVFEDAEIVSEEINIDPIVQTSPLKYDMKDMSPDIASVLNIDFSAGSDIILSMNDLNLPFKSWNECQIEVGLPKCFVLDENSLDNAHYSNSTLTMTVEELVEGFHIPLRSLNFGEEGMKLNDGTLHFEDEISIEIHPTLNSDVYKLSDITAAMGDKTITVRLADSHLHIKPETSQIVIHEISMDIPAVEEPISQTIDNIPAELKYIESVSVTDTEGNPINLRLGFTLSEAPVSHLMLRNVKVELPKCLWIEAEGLDENNVLTIDEMVVNLEGNNAEIVLLEATVRGIKDLAVEDGKIVIDDKVTLNASVTIPEGEILHGSSEDIHITPNVNIPDLMVSEFRGRVGINIEDYFEELPSIDLSSINQALKENNVTANLGIKAPNLLVSASNPIGASVDGNLQLIAFYPGGDQLSLDIPIHINGAEGNTASITRLCLTADAATAPQGYTALTPEGYANLLERVPDSLKLDIKGGIDENSICTLTMNESYVFDIAYSAQIPFEFNGNTNIGFKTAFRGLGGTFTDLGKYKLEVGEIGVVLNTSTTIPLEFSVEAIAIDKDSVKVEGIDLIVGGTIGGSDGINPSNKVLSIGLSGNSEAVPKVDGIALELQATAGANTKFNVNQFLTAKAKIIAKEGITFDPFESFDIGSLFDDDEDEEIYE